MKPKEINDYAKKLWLGAFIIIIILINAFIAYERIQNKQSVPLNPEIVGK